jgi:hypothetical protein
MQTDAVMRAFANNQAAVSQEEVGRIYEEEYIRLKGLQKPNIWDQLWPKLPWFLVVLLGLIVLFRDALKEWLSGFLKKRLDQAYAAIAGRRIFHRVALRHYQRALISKYRWLRIPFRPQRPLDMRTVYVPLKASSSTTQEPLDAKQAIFDSRRLAILAAPGSGKSMLLKQLALTYAEVGLGDLPEEPVPVLLELHRTNDPKLSIEQHLVAELARNDFPHADLFVSRSLSAGTLMLLLDGFDEVSTTERQRVAGEITDLLDRYQKCRAVITCRNAVYREEFAEQTERKLEIMELNDQQVRRFLQSWESEMPVGRSVEALVRTLRDRPRIMALARNPLLLTIIAYLYTDTEYILPHSRAEFYRQSTDFLLGQLHPERNQFEARAKRQVLQHLALFNQDSTSQLHQDRRSMEYTVVLAELRVILPNLNLEPEQASIPLLNEIVERSGLLLAVDGGESYQFAHLTLQEYFAAARLIGDSAGLVERFKNNKDGWREVVKLWCGLDVDSTDLIRSIYSVDPITALECLADGQKVEPDLADQIIAASKIRLTNDDGQGLIAQAFASIASDSRPRGAAVLKFLQESLRTEGSTLCVAAANALSHTNLPVAARTLAEFEKESPGRLRPQLVQMGDLAVPELQILASAHANDAAPALNVLDDLRLIGTPRSASALVPLLWNANPRVAGRAALSLASLFLLPGITDSLRDYQLTEMQKRGDSSWVWGPFLEPEGSALPWIAGRIVDLLYISASDDEIALDGVALDPRLTIPFLAIRERPQLHAIVNEPTPEMLVKAEEVVGGHLLRGPSDSLDYFFIRFVHSKPFTSEDKTAKIAESFKGFVEALLRHPSLSSTIRLVLRSLKPYTVMHLMSAVVQRPISPTDWRYVLRPSKYEFRSGWHFRAILISVFIVSVVAGLKMGFLVRYSHKFLVWSNALLVFLIFCIVIGWWEFFSDSADVYLDAGDVDEFLEFFVFGIFSAPRTFFGWLSQDSAWAFSVLPFFVWMPSVVYFASMWALTIYTWKTVTLAWVVVILLFILLWNAGRRRQQEARNPLQGIIDPSGREMG